jgi:hypothetical protein
VISPLPLVTSDAALVSEDKHLPVRGRVIDEILAIRDTMPGAPSLVARIGFSTPISRNYEEMLSNISTIMKHGTVDLHKFSIIGCQFVCLVDTQVKQDGNNNR